MDTNEIKRGNVHTAMYSVSGDTNTMRSVCTPRALDRFNVKRDDSTGELKTSFRFNPNQTEEGECLSMRDYEQILNDSLYKAGITATPEPRRLDFKFDNPEEDCAHWVKQWQLLIYCFTAEKKAKAKGRYSGKDFWTDEHKSTKVSTDGYEIEVYNKAIQKESEGVYYRAEIRRMRNAHDVRETLRAWQEILRRLPAQYDAVCQHFTDLFSRKWQEEKNKTNSKLKLNQFILEHSDILFSLEQLKDIFAATGKSAKAAYRYSDDYMHDFITLDELQSFAEEQCAIIQKYINEPDFSKFVL